MIVGIITGATRSLGAPRDWDPKRDGRCGSLPIRDQAHSPGRPSMVPAWFPDAGELAALQRGAPVYLTVIGPVHPVVSIAVGAAPAPGERHAERDPTDPTPAGGVEVSAEALIPTTFTGLPILDRPMKATFALPRAPGLDRLRLIVEAMLYGGTLEHVSVLHDGKPTDLFICQGSSSVGNVRNDKATKIYRAAALQRDPNTDPESLPAIYGPAVLVDRRVWS